MSTRSTIIVNYKAGNSIQLYHHCDGYPEYMGELLNSFAKAANFMRYGMDVDLALFNLLKMEKHFEFEKKGLRHGDIEYIWYVTMTEDGYDVSYTETNHLFDKISEIENDDEYHAEYVKIFDGILNAKNGNVNYTK